MSLNALAEKVGIDYQRVRRMERGETQMTIDMLNNALVAIASLYLTSGTK